jgi:hypothetical protein
VAAGLLRLPGRVDAPPIVALVVLAVVAFIVSMRRTAKGRWWRGLAAGFLAGIVGAVLFQGWFASLYPIPDWLMTREAWIAGLAATTAEGVLALAIGAAAARLVRRRTAVEETLVDAPGVALALVAAPLLALGLSALVVPDKVLLIPGRPEVVVRVDTGARLTIDPVSWPTGSLHVRFSNASQQPAGLTFARLEAASDLERLRAGDQQGFGFNAWDYLEAGLTDRLSRLELQPGTYAVIVDPTDPAVEDPRGQPIPEESLVVVTIGGS